MLEKKKYEQRLLNLLNIVEISYDKYFYKEIDICIILK